MANRHLIKEKEMLETLLRHFRAYLASQKPPLQVEPVPNWQMNWEGLDHAARERAELWNLICFYGDRLNPIRTMWYYDTELEFDGSSELARQIYVNRSFDPNELYLLDKVLDSGMTFVDIGANVGAYTLFASRKVGPEGRVVAFEPSRREMAALQRNLDLNRASNVSIHSLAIGESSGEATISIADKHYNGHNTLGELTLSTTLPTIRFTTDRVNHFWNALNDGTTELPIGVAGGVEILIYSEDVFRYNFRSIRIEPAEAARGGWVIEEKGETPVDLPSPLLEAISNMDVRSFGHLELDVNDGLSVSGTGGAGIVFRAQLDGTSEYLVTIEGESVLDERVEHYAVDVVSVDEFFEDFGRGSLDVIKVDIEGGELSALRGADTTIDKYQPLIIAEIVNDKLSESAINEVHQLFVSKKYVLFDVVFGKPRLIDVRGEHGSNIVAVPQRMLEQVLSLGDLDASALSVVADADTPKEQ